MAEDLEEELEKDLGIRLDVLRRRGMSAYEELGLLLRLQKVLTDRTVDLYLRSGIEYRIKGASNA